MTYKLEHPGVALTDTWCPITPEYDIDDLKNFKPGDKVYVIVHNNKNDHFAIDKTKLIKKFSEQFENKFENSWFIDKYSPGHSVEFGEVLYSSFEEAKAVLVQFYNSPKEWKEIMLLPEEELKPRKAK